MTRPPRPDFRRGPFPWLTDERQAGPHFWPVVSPWGLGSLGLLMLGAAALFVVIGMTSGDQERLMAGIFIAILPGGAGAVALVMAIIRWRWFRGARRSRPTPPRESNVPDHPALDGDRNQHRRASR